MYLPDPYMSEKRFYGELELLFTGGWMYTARGRNLAIKERGETYPVAGTSLLSSFYEICYRYFTSIPLFFSVTFNTLAYAAYCFASNVLFISFRLPYTALCISFS